MPRVCVIGPRARLVEVDPADPRTFKQQYDGLNRRIARKMEFMAVEAYQHFYYNASWQILEMRPDSSGNPPEDADPYYQYVWSARYIDSPVLRDRNADADGETGDLGKTGSGLEERLYYLTDANFNVTTLVDTDGDAVEHYQYDPYGKVRVFNGAAPDSDGDEWTAFTGGVCFGISFGLLLLFLSSGLTFDVPGTAVAEPGTSPGRVWRNRIVRQAVAGRLVRRLLFRIRNL